MKYNFTKKLQIAILGILLITGITYYVGIKIRDYQEEKHRIKEALTLDDIGEKLDPNKNGVGAWFNKIGSQITDFFNSVQDFFNGLTNLFEGIDYHFKCGNKTANVGYKRGLKVLEIHFNCAMSKTKVFFDGSCTFYYLVDMYFGILRLLLITIPLFLLKNIFGVDLQFVVDLIKDIIITPLDAITTSTMGISITHWSDDVQKKCYLCPGDFEDGSGLQYKTFSKWSEYYKCTTALINRGSDIMVNSLFNTKHTTNWFKNREVHGWGDWDFKN